MSEWPRAATGATALALCLLLAGPAGAQRAAPQADHAPVRAGWVETAWLTAYGIAIEAKLDTGADNSSLDVGRYELFDRQGRQWVRFSIKESDGAMRMVEAPVLRTARIRRAGTGVSERPVILLALCVAGRTGEAEVTLANRGGMDYAMLIGRSFLAGRLAVDSGKTQLWTGACQEAPRNNRTAQ